MNSHSKYELYKISVIANVEISPNTFILSFERRFEFSPGQVIALTTNSRISPRLYSIASGNVEHTIDILYDTKPDGELTPKLSNLKKGDTVLYSLPFGEFVDNDQPSHWIATGTGIAPFVSMIKSGLTQNKKLIHGARSKQLFYFESFLKEKLQDTYIQCCSQCKGGGYFKGRLTAFLRQYKNLGVKEKFYLCGNAEMVVDVRDILIEKGIPFKNIISEIYF